MQHSQEGHFAPLISKVVMQLIVIGIPSEMAFAGYSDRICHHTDK